LYEIRVQIDFVYMDTNEGLLCQVLMKGLRSMLQADEGSFFKAVDDYCIRVEFQGRGTLHVHICVWASFKEEHDLKDLTGKHIMQGKSNSNKRSPMVEKLESMFNASVDVQVDDGTGIALLAYVTGYASKASDSLQFKSQEYAAKSKQRNKWLCTYRRNCFVAIKIYIDVFF